MSMWLFTRGYTQIPINKISYKNPINIHQFQHRTSQFVGMLPPNRLQPRRVLARLGLFKSSPSGRGKSLDFLHFLDALERA